MSSSFMNPWALLRSDFPLQQLFEPVRGTTGYPKVNVCQGDNFVVLTAELPGLDADALNVEVHDHVLTLAGEISQGPRVPEATYHRNERAFGKFSRQFRLPFRADAERTQATLKHGVLEVTVYPLAEDQPRRIAVSASEPKTIPAGDEQ